MPNSKIVKSKTLWGVFFAALFAGVLLAACGGGGGGSPKVAPSGGGGGGGGGGPAPGAITGISSAGGVITVTSPNTLAVGDVVAITGTTNFNGTFPITSANAGSFTFAGPPAASEATGSWAFVAGVIPGCTPTTTGTAGAITLPSMATVPSRLIGVAPLAVFFDATGTTTTATTRPFHDLEYRWSFGDPAGGATWANGSRAGVSSKNSATGPVAAHVFETPGTYDVNLTVLDGTNTVSNSCVRIAVQDPDVVFAGINTICFSPLGIFTDAPCNDPAVAKSTTSDFVTAMSNATTYKRLLFRRGETWTTSASYTLSAAGPGIVGAYGIGAAPVVRMTGNTNLIRLGTGAAPSFSDWRVMDLDIDLMLGDSSRAVQGTGNASQVLFLRLNIHDGFHGFSFSDPSGAPPWDQIFIVDTTFSNLMSNPTNGQAVFLSATRMAYLGNSVDITRSHNSRFPYISKGVISNNMHANPGPTTSNMKIHATDFLTYPNTYTEQVIISDNKFTSGSADWMIELQPQSTHNDERLRNIIVERNLFKSAAGFNSAVISVSGSEMTLRNNIADITGSVALAGFSVGRFGFCAPTCEPDPENVRIYNNTFYSSDAGVGLFFIELRSTISAALPTQVGNNLGYAPSMTSPKMVKDLATGTVASNNSSDIQVLSAPAWVSLTPTVPAHFALTAPSYIAGGATVPVFSDFFGVIRPNTGAIDIGATEF